MATWSCAWLPIFILVNGKTVRLVGILQDITERKQMQEQLARQEKLAVLGQLAGGVGHGVYRDQLDAATVEVLYKGWQNFYCILIYDFLACICLLW